MSCRVHIYSLNWRYRQFIWIYLQLNNFGDNLQLYLFEYIYNSIGDIYNSFGDISKYVLFIWRYLQIDRICRYLQMNCRYLQINTYIVDNCNSFGDISNSICDIYKYCLFADISNSFGDIFKYADLQISTIQLEISIIQQQKLRW